MTPEQQQEWLKCAKDFPYFATHYLKVLHPDKGFICFQPYDFQRRVIKNYEENRFNIVCKFRQAGLTTLTTLYCLWKCMFNMEKVVLVMSRTDREATKAGKVISKALESLEDCHPWLAPALKVNTLHEKSFASTGSSMEFRTVKASRGQALSYIVIDEAAFIMGMDEAWRDMYPTISTGGRVIVVSTVNGEGNWFATMWHDAKEKRNAFNAIDIDFREHPDYDNDVWIANMKSNMTSRAWSVEFEKSFLGSGNNYFGQDILSRVREQTRHTETISKKYSEYDIDGPKQAVHDRDFVWERGALWIWNKPEPGHEYIIGVDPSGDAGEDQDPSAFQVLDVQTMEQVAEFHSNLISPLEFSKMIAQLGSFYNTALVVVENQAGYGVTILDKLVHNFHYDNIYSATNSSKKIKLGLVNTNITRPIYLNTLKEYLANDMLKIKSRRLVVEMSTFNFNKVRKRPEHVPNAHDDLIFALAFTTHVRSLLTREMPVGIKSMSVAPSESQLSETYRKIRLEIADLDPDQLYTQEEEFSLDDVFMHQDGRKMEIKFERPILNNNKFIHEFRFDL